MSHWTTIQTQIRDIEALRSACAELGLDVLEQTQARGYGANRHRGDYVIQLKGPYDIAAVRQPDGQFTLVADWWQGHVEQEVGRNYGRLLQLYAVHKASREARRRGLRVNRRQLPDGTIKLSIGGL
jgi:hypothetical protein